jgi:hypothetical protein
MKAAGLGSLLSRVPKGEVPGAPIFVRIDAVSFFPPKQSLDGAQLFVRIETALAVVRRDDHLDG